MVGRCARRGLPVNGAIWRGRGRERCLQAGWQRGHCVGELAVGVLEILGFPGQIAAQIFSLTGEVA